MATFTVRNLNCARDSLTLLHAVSFSLSAGELLHLKGANGIGKTTLLTQLASIASLQRGQVCLDDIDPCVAPSVYLEKLAWFGHRLPLRHELTVLENLQWWQSIYQNAKGHALLFSFLKNYELQSFKNQLARELSHGQQKRLAWIILLLKPRTSLWLLDEPLSGLDQHWQPRIILDIATYLQAGGMVLMTSHQDILIEAVVHELALQKHVLFGCGEHHV